ncbi:MAG: TraR/DksA C4-type zinc finger protein [Candidatus Brennerbacteria bacterium]|nr:TraR/DksA C4-type zinc finger protein [Candidatus Brennerbacteria bacterium]
MKQDEKKQLEKKLQEEEKKLEGELEDFKKNLDFGSETDHLEEEADETEEFGAWIGVKRILGRELARVRRALGKIHLGAYGVCESCGKEIELELLEANPASTLCVSCKAKK